MKTKNLFIAGTLSLGLFVFACGGQQTAEAAPVTEEMQTGEVVKVAVDVTASKVNWKGSVLGMHSHEGFVTLKSGEIEMSGEVITGGNFVVDMSSMKATDENYNEEKTSEMLIGHLASPDFFDVENNPTASFVVTGTDGNNLTGNLSIKGKENPATVQNVTIAEVDGNKVATGTLTIDRQQYGVAYKSTMKDVVISDDIELAVSLVVKS